MLAVQTPQMKKFIPQIKQFWEDMDHKRNSEETHINWIILLDEMLRVARIHPTIILPSNVEEFSESENEIFDHESQRSNLEEISDHENEYEMSDDESWNLEKIYNKILEREKKQKEEEKRKKEIEERNEFLKTLFEELKMNYGHLMKIIEVLIRE
jgi:flagellar motility protein MotE (MotC chaperone)